MGSVPRLRAVSRAEQRRPPRLRVLLSQVQCVGRRSRLPRGGRESAV